MPIIKSAIKRARQTKIRTARNKATKTKLRTAIKSVEAAVANGDSKQAQTALTQAQSAIDTAVKKNLIHKNRASRKKAQLNARVKAIAGSTKVAKKASAKKPSAAKKTATKKTTAKKTSAKK